MIEVVHVAQKFTVIRADMTGAPRGAVLPQKPHPRTTIKVPGWTGDLPEPDAAEMAVNLGKAAVKWVAAGFPVVTQAQYDERSAICGPCEYWDGAANLRFGKCKAPGCGCTKFKRWLATEQCKHPQGSKWPAI